jgi:hypothetical protein
MSSYTQRAYEPGRYIRMTSYRYVNLISFDEWTMPLNRGVEIFYEILNFKNFKDFKIEIDLKSE